MILQIVEPEPPERNQDWFTPGIRMMHGNCMEYMATIPDKAFDLAIVDPPYMDKWAGKFAPGSSISTTGVKRDTRGFKHWEVPGEKYFNELFRISSNQIIWGCQYYEIIYSISR